MKFVNETFGNSSFERISEPGWYCMRLIGFCYIGVHGGGQFAARGKVALRWELSRNGKMVTDAEGKVKTIVDNNFSASIRGETNNLRNCLEKHGITIAENAEVDSVDWLGHTCQGFIEFKGEYANLTAYEEIDPNDPMQNVPPQVLKFDNWDPEYKEKPPAWANKMIARSEDISHRATGIVSRRPGAQVDQELNRNPAGSRPRDGGYMPGDEQEEDPIPF